MANITTVARPYAKAILALAKTSDTYAVWTDMLSFLSAVALDPMGSKILRNLAMSPAEKVDFVCSVAAGVLNKQGENLIKVLARAKRLLILPALYQLYEVMREQEEGQVTIDLTLAMPIDIDRAELHVANEVIMHEQVESELICGGVAQIGNRVIDSSVQGRLHALRTLLRK